MKEITLKRRELYILLPVVLSLIIFLQLVVGVGGLIQVSIASLIALPAIVLLFVGTIKWKLCFYFFFLWLLLEGIFRKWILPSNLSTPAFFVKHLILVVPYFYLFTRGLRITKRDYPFLGLLLCYLVWGLLEAFNFRATSDFRVQILGLITHFWFLPLIFLVPMVFNTEEKILKFFKAIAYLSLAIFILGVIQYFSPHGSIINQYAPNDVVEDLAVATVGEYARITGVFSYIGPYNTYLGFALLVILYLVLIGKLTKLETLVFYAGLLLGVMNLIMTGSRAPVAVFIVQALIFLFIIFHFKGKVKKIKKKVLVRFAVAIPLLLFILLYTDKGNAALTALLDRAKSAGDTSSRIVRVYTTPFDFVRPAGLIGYGIGTAYQGSNALVNDWGDMPRNFEEEWGRILLELGLVGFVIAMLIRAYTIFYSWKTFKNIKSHGLKLLALLVFIHQLPMLIGRNIVFSYIDNIIYWFLIGLLVAINRIEIERNNATKSSGISPR